MNCSDLLSSATTKFNDALNNAKSSIGINYDGAFVGMSKDITPLTNEIKKHLDELNTIINNYTSNSDLNTTIKGEASIALSEYLNAIGELLKAYCAYYKNFINLANNAQAKLNASDQTNIQAITNSTNDVQINAKSIMSDIGE